jgi:thiol:disulfide interchange protein DsbD
MTRTCLAVLLAAAPAWAQLIGGEEVAPENAKLTGSVVSVTPATAKAGETVVVKVRLDIPNPWHIYGLKKGTSGVPTKFAVVKGAGKVLDAGVREPTPKHKHYEFKDEETGEVRYVEDYDYHEWPSVEFEVPVELGEAPAGEMEFALSVEHMLCTEATCLDKGTISVAGKVMLQAGGVVKPPDPPPSNGTATEPPKPAAGKTSGERAKESTKSLLAFLGAAVLTGLVTLITPCVFPMIPVTISFFTKQASSSRGGTLGLATTYGLGIVISYTLIGFIASAALGEDGAAKFSGNPWVNVVIAGIFVVFALSLFGWFELTLPGSVTNAMSAQGKSGFVGAFLLGLTFAVTAFTCAAPFAATILALAVHGERGWAFLGLLTYSATMAVPFVLLGLFPNAVKALPRSGGWLTAVKVVFGFVELAAACKFIANADVAWQWGFVSRSGVVALWTACSAFCALYLLGLLRLKEDAPSEGIGVPRMLWALAFGTVSLWLASGLFGRHLGIVEAYLPLPEETQFIGGSGPVSNGGGAGIAHKEYDSYGEALAAAKRERKPLFLEFTAFN